MGTSLTHRAVRALVRVGQLECQNDLLRTVIAEAVQELRSAPKNPVSLQDLADHLEAVLDGSSNLAA